MSEYVYGHFYPDSDVDAFVKNGVYIVMVGDRHYVSDRPMPDTFKDALNWIDKGHPDHAHLDILRAKAKWYAIARRMLASSQHPGCKHEFINPQEANAFLLRLRETGFMVPDWILFTAS